MRMAMASPMPCRPLTRNIGCGQVGGAARDARYVAKTDDPTVRDEIDGEDILLGPEHARDADEDLLVPGLHHPLRRDGVLGVKGGNQRGAIDPEARPLAVENSTYTRSSWAPRTLDLRDVRQLEELLSNVVHIVPSSR